MELREASEQEWATLVTGGGGQGWGVMRLSTQGGT